MYTAEEKQYLSLNAKFQAELNDIEQQIKVLEARWGTLKAILDGTAEPEPEMVVVVTQKGTGRQAKVKLTKNELHLAHLVDHLEKNPGIGRLSITEFFSGKLDANQVKRVLERGRRQGVIVSEGRGRAAVWYAAEVS